MPLSPGTRIGHYEIVAALGAGGMGEVYRARDAKLQRDVAIKVLPDDVAADPERRSRFEREARTLAALNHPHIAQIHGIEDRAIVMELVEGDDLAVRLARGPVPVDEAIGIARQIAEALDAAHSAGIVHRDLKPANVKVRADGTVKVLDFGLARGGHAAADLRDSPTFTSPAATQAGVILGTAAYMAPEQARGKVVDKRSDIWAFGCVVFELLTARPAFEGETVTDVLSAVVRSEPDWRALPAETPPALRRLLQRCLQKDAAKRLRDIGDARIELDEAPTAIAESAAVSPAPATAWPRKRRAALAVGWGASLIAIAVASAAAVSWLRPAATERVLKLSIPIENSGIVLEPVISPDGRRVAFIDPARARLTVRALDEWTARGLDGTEGAVRPFWSPDSQWLAYIRSEQLLKVPAEGGPVVRVATLPAVQAPLRISNGVWTSGGDILVSLASGAVLRVSAGGGEPIPVDALPSDGSVRNMVELPDGGLLIGMDRSGGKNAIAVIDDDGLRIIHEGIDVRRPVYAPAGYVLFASAGNRPALWAAPFSLQQRTLTGEPFIIGEGSEPTVARDGTVAYVPTAAVARDLSWFTLDGAIGPRLSEPREWIEGAAISRDGRRVLASTTDGIWAYDAGTGARDRLTSGTSDMTPQWVDANHIVFVRTQDSLPAVVLKRLGPGGDEQVIAYPARFPRVTADGERVVFNLLDRDAKAWDIAWIDRDRSAEIHRLPALHRGARFPSVSPDGTLVAYVSGEVGHDEVFLTRMPGGEGKWQLSTNGGGWTLFHPSGSAVLYRTPDNVLMSVPITGGDEVKIGPPRRLFDWGSTWAPFYDLAADGTRGVTALPLAAAVAMPTISIVQNWHLEFPR
jgi:Tol biopolymer transport system component